MTKVVCWNMGWKRESWRTLARMQSDVDVALLQEVCRVPHEVADDVDLGPHDDRATWDPRLWESDKQRRKRDFQYRRWPKIAKLSDRVRLEWFKPVLLCDPVSEQELRVSDPHTIAAARVFPLADDSEPFIVVSMYAHWQGPHPSTGRKDAHVDASAHRAISDLSPFVAHADRVPHRILAAGDLNIDYGLDYGWWQEGDAPLWYARCRTVWDRMEALGFEYMGPRYPNGRRADPTLRHLAKDTKNVPTQCAPKSLPRLQLDHVFASRGFHETVHTRALNEVDEWGPSDHCRLLIKVGT